MQDVHVIIKGFVQGVGFRKWLRKVAKGKDLTGWVRNLPDGSVEALLQGGKGKLEEVILDCRKGPFLAEVEDVNVMWEEGKEQFSDFSIRHDL